MNFDWLKWDFQNLKLIYTFSQSHLNYMAIGPIVTKNISKYVLAIVYTKQKFSACTFGADKWRDCDEINVS